MVKSSVIEAKFNRVEISPQYTFLWKSLSESQKRTFEWLNLNVDENIIICYHEDNRQFILTTQRVIKSDECINYSEIEKVSIKGLDVDKSKINTIILNLKNGNEIELIIEKSTWFVLYDILKLLIKG